MTPSRPESATAIDDLGDFQDLADVVRILEAAERRAQIHCRYCGVGDTMAIESARNEVVATARLLVRGRE